MVVSCQMYASATPAKYAKPQTSESRKRTDVFSSEAHRLSQTSRQHPCDAIWVAVSWSEGNAPSSADNAHVVYK